MVELNIPFVNTELEREERGKKNMTYIQSFFFFVDNSHVLEYENTIQYCISFNNKQNTGYLQRFGFQMENESLAQ